MNRITGKLSSFPKQFFILHIPNVSISQALQLHPDIVAPKTTEIWLSSADGCFKFDPLEKIIKAPKKEVILNFDN